MKEIIFKRSAIHNLVITNCRNTFKRGEIVEGLVIPKNILRKSDILPWEQVIVTKINGNNWINRIKTFVIEGENNGKVEARGSLAKFLKKGDLTCLITRTLLNEKEVVLFKFPIFDLGFDPDKNKDNTIENRLDIEYGNKKIRGVKDFKTLVGDRKEIKHFFLSSLILGLKINKTHPDCLQGSAELPGNIMTKASVEKYQSVSVYNSSKGGVADTYAVPMPPKVVMTTGAMAQFAKKGEIVNVATYVIGIKGVVPVIISTNGSEVIKKL
ncbi:aspartate 1-decarboxylase [Candidatus Falkowbacteria bacterium]|nr:aspartate 1-decarboxylase [Candidatus Falkowbacteria bacterium]